MTQELKNTTELENKNANTITDVKKRKMIISKKYEEVDNELSNIYPRLFNKQGVNLLKVGIRKEIAAAGNLTITKSQLTTFLKVYCSSNSYRKLHVENAKRYDLDGNESGTVTKKHIEGLARLREEAKKKWELKKQKQKESAKRQESENNNSTIRNCTNSQKNKKKSIYSNKNNDQKVKKLEINQDNLENIKFTNSNKPKLGIKV